MNKFATLDDISGKVFGRLTAIHVAGKYKNGSVQWKCSCSCGGEAIVLGQKLRNGHTKSCGCLSRETAKANRTKHGKSNTRLFRIWSGMLNRCTNPKSTAWKYYGGRGINVCDEWRNDFASFHDWAVASGYSDVLTIEREDVDGGYHPANCRWATVEEQALNKRNNVRLADGRMAYPASSVSAAQLRKRLRGGMSLEDAALTPPMRQRHLLADGRSGVDVAASNGISSGTFNQRVRAYGWSPDRAATTPVRGH